MTNRNTKGVITNEETLQSKMAFFDKYKKPIFITIIAIFIVIAGAFAYKAYVVEPNRNKASTALARGQEYFGMEIYDKALNGDSTGYIGLIKIADQYSNTNAGNLAKLYAGLCYAKLDKWKEATEYLNDYSPSNDAMVSPTAIAALANAYVHINEVDKAIDTFKKAAKRADGEANGGKNNSISPIFLLEAGQLLEHQNKKEDALKIYQNIKAQYLTSAIVQSGEIDKYIERTSEK